VMGNTISTAFSSDSLSIEQDSTKIIPDEKVIVNQIIIIGNKITKAKIITRELAVQEGDQISSEQIPDILAQGENNLMNTRLFNSAQIDLVYESPSQANIIIEVDERWYIFPSPILETGERNFNDWWKNSRWDFSKAYYGGRVMWENVRGLNDRLLFKAQFGFIKSFDIDYKIPYINKAQTLGVSFFAGYRENRSFQYTINKKVNKEDSSENQLIFLEKSPEEGDLGVSRRRRSGGMAFFYRPDLYNYHNFSIQYYNAEISDTIAEHLNPDYFLNGNNSQKFLALTYTYRIEKRDYVSYPLRGYFFELYLQKLGLGVFNDINQLNVSAAIAKYLDLGNGFFLSGRLEGKSSLAKKVPYNQLPALGFGNDLVRGFELYVIPGQHYILQKTTFKKRLLSVKKDFKFIPVKQFRTIPLDIYLKTFFDSGYASFQDNLEAVSSPLSNRYHWGTGLGLDIVTFYDTLFGLEFSLNSINETAFR
ncbi:POTRA domain-containing protein, partial [Xanthovirga aplysinae]|uniref:POTRA domain-containing protein n=1 Tax=Xanthovirga aplysinae TaxID=2529853 RepID=UPI0012BD7660